MIFVRKQLSSAQGGHRRVGIIGTVALVQRLGAASSDALESESAIGGAGVQERGWGLTSDANDAGIAAQLPVHRSTHRPTQPPWCPLAGKRYQEAMGALKDTFDSCQRRCGLGASRLYALPARCGCAAPFGERAAGSFRRSGCSAPPPHHTLHACSSPMPAYSRPTRPPAAAPRPLPSCATSCAAACCATRSGSESAAAARRVCGGPWLQ